MRAAARAIRTAKAISRPGAAERGIGDKGISPARQDMVDLRVGRRHMIEARVEIARRARAMSSGNCSG